MKDRQMEMNRWGNKRRRLNQKYCQLINDGYDFHSPKVQQIRNTMDELDNKIGGLRIGLN